MKSTFGPFYSKRDEYFDALTKAGVDIHDQRGKQSEGGFEKDRLQYLTSLRDEIIRRFPPVALLGSLGRLFSPDSLPPASLPPQEIATHGSKDLDVVLNHWGSIVNVEFARLQWPTAAMFLSRLTPRPKSMQDVLATLLEPGRAAILPDIQRIAIAALALPVTSVECERGFSTLNLIKTKLRNRLNTDTLCALIRIKIEGPPVNKFDFASVASMWFQESRRRILFSDSGDYSTVQLSACAEESDSEGEFASGL
jgi:hypothetical protein